MGNSVIPPPELEFAHEEIEKIEKKHRRDTMSPYEIPVDDYEFASPNVSAEYSKDYGWVCGSLAKAIDIIKTHHNHPEYNPDFFNTARFEIYLQLDMQYAYAYIQLTGGPVYPIHIHNSLKEDSEQPLTSNYSKIPDWVKNIFSWYSQDQVSEDELLNAIKYLINEKILIVN